MFTAQARRRRRRRTQNARRVIAVLFCQGLFQLLRRPESPRLILVTREEQHHRHERTVAVITAMTNFLIVESSIVLRLCVPQRVVMRMISLNQDASRQVATTCASGDLRDQSKGTFSGTKIRKSQSGVHRNDAYQSDVGKIVTFGQHLRAHEQIQFALAEIQQGLFELMSAGLWTAVDSAAAQTAKPLGQPLFNLVPAL